jgi:outer membrane protein assembly factor BamB
MKVSWKLTLLIVLAALWSGVTVAQQSTRNLSNSPKVDPAWPQYGFLPNHPSFDKTHQTLTRTNVSSLTWKWVGEVGAPIASAPVVGSGIAYVAAGGTIYAFEASDGASLWSHLACGGDKDNAAQPALGSQALFVGDAGGELAAYDPATGNQLWCSDVGREITSAPAVDATNVYITNGASAVAVDQLTGTPRWFFTPADLSPVTNTPAVYNGGVYVTGGNSVFALAGTTGQQLWRTDLGPQYNISAPAVAGNTVYVGGSSLYALSASTGSLLWTQNQVGVNVTMPAIAYGKVFVNSQDPRFGLWAFQASNGAFLWRNQTAEEPLSTVTVVNGIVFDIVDTAVGGVIMFDSDTGAVLGRIVDPDGHPFNDFFGSQPAVVGGAVYIPTADYLGSNRLDVFGLP